MVKHVIAVTGKLVKTAVSCAASMCKLHFLTFHHTESGHLAFKDV